MSSKVLIVRNDDVLVHSRQFANREFERFKGKHELICQSSRLLHAPAILVTEIQDFPQCIQYVREETEAGRMRPELHGFQHIDYASLSVSDLNDHLTKSLEWFQAILGVLPTRWYTPFGAGNDERGYHLNAKAKEFGMTLYAVDTGTMYRDVIGSPQIETALRWFREGMTFDQYLDKYDDTLMHFWAMGSKTERLLEVSKYGSYKDATIMNKKLFT